MISHSRAVVAAPARLEVLASKPPLTLRRVHDDDDEVCALCLVGTAAGPLAGDDLTLSLHLRAGARARLAATGAMIAQGRAAGRRSTVRTQVCLDSGAQLTADPGPLIVCAGARVDLGVRIDLAVDATVSWRETVVLGRAGAPAGSATITWDVTVAGAPLLRQALDLSDAYAQRSPSLLAGATVMASELLVGPQIDARTVIASPRAAAQQLSEHAVLLTVLADDAATAATQLDALRAAYRPPAAASPGSRRAPVTTHPPCFLRAPLLPPSSVDAHPLPRPALGP